MACARSSRMRLSSREPCSSSRRVSPGRLAAAQAWLAPTSEARAVPRRRPVPNGPARTVQATDWSTVATLSSASAAVEAAPTHQSPNVAVAAQSARCRFTNAPVARRPVANAKKKRQLQTEQGKDKEHWPRDAACVPWHWRNVSDAWIQRHGRAMLSHLGGRRRRLGRCETGARPVNGTRRRADALR